MADTLSRAYYTETKPDIESAVNKVDDSEESMFSDNMMLPGQKLTELQHATRNDAVLQELEKAIKTGWPAVSTINDLLKSYLQFKNEMLAEDGLVFKGGRLVIPRMMRAGMINQIPGHIGVEGCIRRAREVICWPGMNAEVKDHVSKCDVCNALTDRAEQTVSLGHHYSILVDYYSNFFEINELKKTTIQAVVKMLRPLFAR